MVNKVSPNRRRSIAVLGQSSSKQSQSRRRAYSIAPGEKLSPAAKARRSLAPRKSILKASINFQDGAESSTFTGDDNITQTMDFTDIHNAAARKSLGRRVSFASHAHVRIFERKKTNGSADPPFSPTQGSFPQTESRTNDENVYPDTARGGRRSSVRRRSSTRFSEFGEQSMDMDIDDDAPVPDDFINENNIFHQEGSALEDDEFTEDEDDEDMEVTEAIRLNINRKRSLSLGPGHPSLALRRRSSIAPATSTQHQSENQIPRPGQQAHFNAEPKIIEEGQNVDQDLTTSSAQSQSYLSEDPSDENTAPMEFTIPISRSLRPPPERSEVWQQLAAITHAGVASEPPPESDEDEPFLQPDRDDTAEDMDLTAATQRLLRARSSIGLPPLKGGDPDADAEDDFGGADSFDDGVQGKIPDDSFTSTEDSFADDGAAGDRTMNITALMRQSLGATDSSMDVTGVYDDENVVRVPVTAPRERVDSLPAPVAPAEEAPPTSASLPSVFTATESARPSVFSIAKTPVPTPRSPAETAASAIIPKPFTFSLVRTPSPTKGAAPSPAPSSSIPRPIFGQARPHKGTAAFASPTPRKSPLKRPITDSAQDRPSPAKRPAVGRLEPAKVAIFEPPQPQPMANRRTSAVRRPSGYFAQRKSLGAGILPPTITNAANADTRTAAGPKKIAGQGLGLGRFRASVGAVPSGNGPGIGVGQSQPGKEGTSLYPDVANIVRQDPPTPSKALSPAPGPKAGGCEREVLRQVVAAPSPTRGSPAPALRPSSPALGAVKQETPQRSASPAVGSPRRPSPAVIASTSESGIILDLPLKDVDIPGILQTAPLPSAVTAQWRDGVEDDAGFEDEGPPISIEQFFTMTGIRFMDELTMPKPRQSVVPPMQLRSRARRRSSSEFVAEQDEDPIPLAEFSIAMAVEVPQLEIYTAVVNDLTAWIGNSKKICLEAERETEKDTPELFREFAAADESEKAMLVHQLKLIKANNYGTAKSQWYDWKTTWVNRLYDQAEQEFSHLESDAQVLADLMKEAQDILPALRGEYAQVMAELQQEQADISEIENSDQDFLNELKATIAEQQYVRTMPVFRSDVSEGKAKLERLEEKLAEINAQKKEASVAIAEAQYFVHLKKEGTNFEVFRLKEELEALQDLHYWRATKVQADLTEFVYASRYQVSIPCLKYRPTLAKVSVCKAKNIRTRERDQFPRFTDLAIQVAQQLVFEAPPHANIREIVELLGDFWSSCAQLRAQLTFLAIKYPLSVEAVQSLNSGLPDLHIKATVLFPSAKGKAYISFILDRQTYSKWPISIGSLKATVEVAYGRVE
ncbi:Spc7 kinetochore protein-domain-containing protein [Sparassis latifolia]